MARPLFERTAGARQIEVRFDSIILANVRQLYRSGFSLNYNNVEAGDSFKSALNVASSVIFPKFRVVSSPMGRIDIQSQKELHQGGQGG